MRKNGFSFPLSKLQISSYLLGLLQISSFYFITLPLSDMTYLPMSTIPYTILLFLLLYYSFKVTVSNPCDPILLTSVRPSGKLCKLCTVCDSAVLIKSKHCSLCEKCIQGFDHHCRILNNCIGRANYELFFKLIIIFELLILVQMVTTVIVTSKASGWFLVFIIFEDIFFVLSFLVNGAFILFHCWIRKKGVTTYEYIMNRHKRSRSILPILDKTKTGDNYVINSPQNNSFISVSKDAPTVI